MMAAVELESFLERRIYHQVNSGKPKLRSAVFCAYGGGGGGGGARGVGGGSTRRTYSQSSASSGSGVAIRAHCASVYAELVRVRPRLKVSRRGLGFGLGWWG